MNIPRQRKGEFGYPPYERKRVIIRTAAYFLISIAVFLLGYFSTGQKERPRDAVPHPASPLKRA